MEDPPPPPPSPLETARALSDLYAFQCSQWVPIRNSQIIGRYKEIPVQRKHVDTKGRWPPRQRLEMVYSFIYIYCHLELSKWRGQSCISFYGKFLYDFIMLLLLLLLLLLCITPQHIYVVVVVYFYWSLVSISRNKRALFVK